MKEKILILLYILMMLSCNRETEENSILKEDFFNKIENNEVKSVTFFSNSDYAEVSFYNNNPNLKYTYYDIKILRKKLNNHKININYEEKEKTNQHIFSWIVSLVFLLVIFVFITVIVVLGIKHFKKTSKN
tara:strand:+ start:407 stop:799 length:393 start_codon:yes stop_codon:yes gene_type:complete